MKKSAKIAVAGNQWITRFLIAELCKAGFAPELIINMDESHAGAISGYTDLADAAGENGIDIYRPEVYSLKSEKDMEALSAYDIGALVVFGWQRLIPEWLIDRCEKGVYGVHGGPEKPPRCRGRAVFNWAVIMGYERFYMYLFKITPAVDDGNIIALREFDITPFDDIRTLYNKNCIVTSRMVAESLPAILDGSIEMAPQPDTPPTYLPKRTPEDGEIFWDRSAKSICDLIRAVAPPYPGAFTRLNGEILRIHAAHLFDTKIELTGEPGQVMNVFDNGDFIALTGDYPVYVRAYEGSAPKEGDVFAFEKNKPQSFPVV